MDKKDFLLELGCEELPAKYQNTLAKNIATLLESELKEAHLEHGEVVTYATPRRVAIMIADLATIQPSQEIERQGPSYNNAYDKDGTPTLACIGFARSCNVSADQLEINETPKGKRVVCRVKQEGKPSADLLPNLIDTALKKLHLPKPMRWGNGEFTFIRPVHWVVMLYGRDVVSSNLFGKPGSRYTFGHRFHNPHKISITEPRDYHIALHSQGYVIADYVARREKIAKDIQNAAGSDQAVINSELLDEVTALVEWPVTLQGSFNEGFLSLPREVLITSMATHLKCFPIENKEGRLLPKFIVISNIESESPALITKGNERVLNARLSDADFFYKNDLKQSLESRLSALDHVIFQKQLGTLTEKSQRLVKLVNLMTQTVQSDSNTAKRAALLSKCDLVSEMVIEFPKLQGIMGYYYALNDKETEKCAKAIKEQYLPRFSGDVLPSSPEGALVALADRIDTLVGIFGINKQPTGDRDPFGLRRAAVGVLRICIEKQLPLNIEPLIQESINTYSGKLANDDTMTQSIDFIMGRLKAWYLEKGVTPDIFEAVYACQPLSLFDFHRRVEAVQAFLSLPEAAALASANKRVSNLLKKAETSIPNTPDESLFKKTEEKQLAQQISSHQKAIISLYENSDYEKALTELSSLKEPVDAFFDEVMIMDEDKKVRNNRLALLNSLRQLFTQVADISLLQ